MQRAFTPDEEWKEEVKRRMGAARLVVIRAGVGENLLWEAKHAFETLNPQKVLILVLNMKAKDYESFRTKVNPLLGVSLPEGGHQRPVTVRASCGKIAVQFTRWRWTKLPTATASGSLHRVSPGLGWIVYSCGRWALSVLPRPGMR